MINLYGLIFYLFIFSLFAKQRFASVRCNNRCRYQFNPQPYAATVIRRLMSRVLCAVRNLFFTLSYPFQHLIILPIHLLHFIFQRVIMADIRNQQYQKE